MWGDPFKLFEVWGKPGTNNIKSGGHRSVTFRYHCSYFIYCCFFQTEFICKFSSSPSNAESGIKQGLGFLWRSRMHRGCCKTYTSHVKRKDVFRSSSFTIPTGSHWFSLLASSKGHQFTGNVRRVGVGHLDSVYMHTPYQFCQSITPHSTNRRHISWSFKSQPRPSGFNGPPDNEEDAARIAILNKVMKGRQPTDLILRCKWNFSSPFSAR